MTADEMEEAQSLWSELCRLEQAARAGKRLWGRTRDEREDNVREQLRRRLLELNEAEAEIWKWQERYRSERLEKWVLFGVLVFIGVMLMLFAHR